MTEKKDEKKSREPRSNKRSKPSAINRAIKRGESKTNAIVRGQKHKLNVKSSRKNDNE
jgi:hypothetical protein